MKSTIKIVLCSYNVAWLGAVFCLHANGTPSKGPLIFPLLPKFNIQLLPRKFTSMCTRMLAEKESQHSLYLSNLASRPFLDH